MNHALHDTITAAHERLEGRLERARTAMRDHEGRRQVMRAADTFGAEACRHTAAVCDVLLPLARRTPEGRDLVRTYLQRCRSAEYTLLRAKQYMYGEVRATAVPWQTLWTELEAEGRALRATELELVEAVGDAADETLAERFAAAAAHGPTRPHPHSPHVGRLAHLSRRWWARMDHFWDRAEGRIVADRPLPPAQPDAA